MPRLHSVFSAGIPSLRAVAPVATTTLFAFTVRSDDDTVNECCEVPIDESHFPELGEERPKARGPRLARIKRKTQRERRRESRDPKYIGELETILEEEKAFQTAEVAEKGPKDILGMEGSKDEVDVMKVRSLAGLSSEDADREIFDLLGFD